MTGTALAEFIPELSVAPIAAQRAFDAQYQRDLDGAARAASLLFPVLGPGIAAALVPRRLQVTRTRLQTRVRVQHGRGRRFALTVAPVGLGFTVLFETKTASLSQITMTVEQIPLPGNIEEALGGQQVDQ